MKKKFISLFLVFIFSFTLISTIRQKETKAVATTIIAGYTISQILGAMALSASVVAGGYVISDVLVEPEDNSDFTEFLKVVFNETLNMQKFENGPPPPKPLTALESTVIWSMLTKQGIEIGTDLYTRVYEYFNAAEDLPPHDFIGSNGWLCSTTSAFRQYYVAINPGTIFYQTNKYWTRATNTLHSYKQYLHNGVWGPFEMYTIEPHEIIFSTIPVTGNQVIYQDNTYTTLAVNSPVEEGYKPIIKNEPDFITAPDTMTDPSEYIPIFRNVDMSPLNGLVKNPQELIDIVNGVKQVPSYVYGKITTAFNDIYNNFLENPNFIGADAPTTPVTDPNTGTLYFGDPLPDEPQIESPEVPENELSFWGKVLFWLKGIWSSIRDLPGNIANSISNAFTWLRNWIDTFWTNVNTLIDDFWMTFSTWWQDNFLYHWTTFIDWINTLPGLISGAFTGLFDLVTIPLNALVGLIQDVWNWLQGVPEMIYGFFVPPSTDIAQVWEPLISLWQDKLEPVKAPLDQLLFHETELQDISADLEFNGIGGTYKIIDYQYVKSVKDQVKGVIRAFFWILIIFFNVDQVHRLIRNQGIIKSYVRKIDEPGGKS